MGLAEVERVQILAHASLKTALLSSLQEAGIVQLDEAPRGELGLGSFSPDISHLDHLLHRLKHGLDFLSRWEGRRLLDKIAPRKPALSGEAREELRKYGHQAVLERIEKIESEQNELLSHARFLEKEIEFLLPLADLSLPLSFFKSSNLLEIMLGTLPSSRREEFVQLEEESPLWHEIVFENKRSCSLLLYFLKRDKDFFESKFKELDFSPIYLAEPVLAKAAPGDRIKDVIDKNRREVEEISMAITELDKEVRKMALHWEKLGQLYDVLSNDRDRLASSRLLGGTDKTVYLEGWVRSSDVQKLRAALAPHAEHIELSMRPPLPEEEPPVVLENRGPVQPFEVITNLYGLPTHGSRDPTVPLAPFFFIFVGLCVSEAGYGLVVTLLSLLYLKFVKPKGGARLFARLLFYLGISNIILGTLVGGWFGFPIRPLLLIDPLKEPIAFLVLSLILGFIQVWFGTFLNLIDSVKKKNFEQAAAKVGWLLLLPSLVVFFLTKQTAAGILALVGASGVVAFAAPQRNPVARFFGGLYGLYGISAYIGDTLSYSRLLALGLSTGVIAMVVNTLCRTALGVPWIGWLLAAIIFVGGHLFNLAIGFLGGFVHSMRLQFVEFFTKFFAAGGKSFRPFKMEGKFVEFI